MSRIDVGETFTVTTTVISRTTNLPVDAAQITLKWKIGAEGTWHTETPTHDSTGVYSVSLTPTESGLLYGRWDTDGAYDVAKEFVILVRRSAFETSSTSDYN